MNFKRIKVFCLCGLAALLAVVTLSACDKQTADESQNEPNHTHTEVIDAAVPPTCTAGGMSEGKHCAECGYVIVAPRSIAALGHQEVENAAVAPTCSRTGLTAGKYCARCQEILVVQSEVPMLAHTEVSTAAVEPTCTAAGKTASSFSIFLRCSSTLRW